MKSALRSGSLKSSWPTLCAASTRSVDPAFAGHRRDLGDRQDQARAVAEVGDEGHPDRGIGVEGGPVGVDQRRRVAGSGSAILINSHPATRASDSMLVCMLS